MASRPVSRRLRSAFVVTIGIAMLAGCASIRRHETHTTPPYSAQHWQMTGKLGVRSDRGSANLQISWMQEGDHYSILLDSLLGRSLARISGDSEQVTLEVAGEPSMTSASVEHLTREVLGWSFPAANILFWLQGEPAPGSAFDAAQAADGHLVMLRQSGWSIHYEGDELPPTRMRFEREGVELRLVIQSWNRDPDSD